MCYGFVFAAVWYFFISSFLFFILFLPSNTKAKQELRVYMVHAFIDFVIETCEMHDRSTFIHHKKEHILTHRFMYCQRQANNTKRWKTQNDANEQTNKNQFISLNTKANGHCVLSYTDFHWCWSNFIVISNNNFFFLFRFSNACYNITIAFMCLSTAY